MRRSAFENASRANSIQPLRGSALYASILPIPGEHAELPVLGEQEPCEAIACFMIYEGEAVHFSLAMPALTASHSSAFRIPTRAAALWQSNFG